MAAKPKTAPLPSIAEMADELGQLQKEYDLAVAPFDMKLKRIATLEKALRLVCPAKPSEEWIAAGAKFDARLGPCANERSIDFKKLIKKITLGAFGKFATCTLSALEKHVSSEVFAEVVSTHQSGPRKISIIEKGIAA